MRHTDAGLAIPDFPLMFGHLVADALGSEDRDPLRPSRRRARRASRWPSSRIVWRGSCDHAPRPHASSRARRRCSLALVAVQVTLGALTVLSRRDIWINSLHVVCGALVLTTSLVLTLRTWRVRFADATDRRPAADAGRYAADAASGFSRTGARA